MHHLAGGCHCRNIRVEADLSRAASAYNPRACDCDFCRKHGAAYVSDPDGALRIFIATERECVKYRQGSGTADCLLCRKCGVLIGALYQSEGARYAAINAKVLEGGASFGGEQAVSPQNLSEVEKAKRWRDIWFPNVQIVIAGD